ncbi:MAG TPA: MotE family protein [Candidatus Bathyarchaeia archaeon]|nr:MotE family protein [Candidatus Bathyarchaeia archaeon]
MEEIQEERGYSKWEWFFYMIFIPALFATLLGGVLLSLLGVNVVGKALSLANQIPYVEKVVPDTSAEVKPDQADKENLEKQLVTAQSELAKSKQTVTAIETEAAKKDATIQTLQKQAEDLQKMIEEKRASEEERQKQYADLAKIYTTMSAGKAAPIIENLTTEEAVTVLSKMKPEQRAEILAKMDPKKAADTSILIKDTVINEDDDIAAMQQRIQALTKALSETRQDSTSLDSLITTFSQMPATESSLILKSLMTTNQNRAISILAGMANDKRAQVLAEIAKEDDKLAAKITSELLR